MLVDPLPAGAKFVVRRCYSSMIVRTLWFYLKAVFDACNSATLLGKTFDGLLREPRDTQLLTLDLEHHRCNRVFVPWVNKGFRRTQSRWNNVGESILLRLVDSSIDQMTSTTSTAVCV